MLCKLSGSVPLLKISSNLLQAMLKVFSRQKKTHLLEWEKPLLYLSADKKAHSSVLWEALGFPREEFALTGSICKPSPETKQPSAICPASFSKSSCCPEMGRPRGIPPLGVGKDYCCLFLSVSVLGLVVSTLHDPRGCSPQGSSVHGILQARMLQRVAISSSRGSSCSGNRARLQCRLHWQGDSSPLSHQESPFAELRARPGKRPLTILLKVNKHFRSRDFYEYWNFPSQDRCKLYIFVLRKILIGWGMRELFSHYFPPM